MHFALEACGQCGYRVRVAASFSLNMVSSDTGHSLKTHTSRKSLRPEDCFWEIGNTVLLSICLRFVLNLLQIARDSCTELRNANVRNRFEILGKEGQRTYQE